MKKKISIPLFLTLIFMNLTSAAHSSDPKNSHHLVGEEARSLKGLKPAEKFEEYSPRSQWEPLAIFRCLAGKPNGALFDALGVNPYETQDRAMYRCFQFPPSLCRPLGCRIVDNFKDQELEKFPKPDLPVQSE